MSKVGLDIMTQRMGQKNEERKKRIGKERKSTNQEVDLHGSQKSHSFSFVSFTCTIRKKDPQSIVDKAIKDFKELCEKNPDDSHILVNEKTGEMTFLNGSQMLKSPQEKGEVDEECLVKAIQYLEKHNGGKKLQDKCYGFMIQMLREGWMGSGWSEKEKKECIKWMRDNTAYDGTEASKNVYDYIADIPKERLTDETHTQRWPNWKNLGKRSMKVNGKMTLQKEAVKFGKEFHDTYWDFWKHKYRTNDDLTELSIVDNT